MAGQSKEALIPPWGLAVAGATGAVIANALVYPLDIVKTRLQVQVKRKATDAPATGPEDIHYTSTWHAITKIVDDDGILGLYNGINGALLGVASTNFAYFYWYSVVRTLYLARQTVPTPPSTAIELSLGAAAGAVAQLFTIPIAVVTTRQQTQSKIDRKGMLDTAREVIHSEDGWTGLWRGLKASLVLVVNPAITYGAYQRLREVIFPGKLNLRPGEAFLLGALSKSLATIATQPLIVAKVGLQSKPPPSRAGKPFKSFIEVMRFIIQNEGLLGLFKGIGPQISKGLIVQGLLMMTKERMELMFVLLFRYLRKLRSEQLQKAADIAASKAKQALPLLVKTSRTLELSRLTSISHNRHNGEIQELVPTQPVEEGSPKRVILPPRERIYKLRASNASDHDDASYSVGNKLTCLSFQYQEAKDLKISISQRHRPKVPKKSQTCATWHNEGIEGIEGGQAGVGVKITINFLSSGSLDAVAVLAWFRFTGGRWIVDNRRKALKEQ
ncbi:Mitochondrial carrier [Glarea lozoyensis ATCC 20868]|uniref:Mitochondrial carrier n=1 Tax=Glarea lozoyensis (strain ATCC 20868 / MF5171) TaxID=1116229 RepID=S3ECS0_GLAL2|nr:Mitochondrial carrier [Glarea lozoyensis ATCC 20868]EPE36103.1 Mitochondrial carrier [Glarea lozoyensis ATCC 20868]